MIKKLAARIGGYKKDTILTPVFMVGEVSMEIMIPFLMAMMIDDGINAGDMGAVLRIGLLLLAAATLALLFGALSGRFAANASAGFAKNLRKDMYDSIQKFSFSNIDRFSTSGLVTRLTTDVTNLQNAFQMIIRVAVRAPLMFIFALIMSFTINARLALIFLAAVPVLGIGLYFLMTRAHPLFEKVFKMYDKLNNVVQENIRGIRVVKSYVREDHEVQKFEGVSKNIYDTFVKAEKLLAFNAPLMQFCLYGCTLLISWFGAKMIVGGSMSTGQLTSLMSYAIQILMSLMMVSMILVMVIMARASAERVVEVLDETSDIQNGVNPKTQVADGSIVFHSVDFSYSGQETKLALKNIGLEIPSGQTVGIIGGTGTGKSSLVQLVPRLYDATSGQVLVGGVNVKEYDLETLRDEVAMVLQKNTLFSGTIKDNLRWGNKQATDEELAWACRLAQADDFIRSFPDGYDTVIDQGGTNVSGGQKQRLCIARALLKKPKIIIFDDSTSAVDTRTDALIRKGLREDLPGTTKIIIAQRITSVQNADMIVVMNDGRIDAVGSHEELLESNEIYREVYESQQKGGSEDAA